MLPRQVVLVLILVLGVGPAAHAVLVNLTPEQTEEAIAHGKASYERLIAAGKAIDDLDPEYVVDLGPDVGRAMLFTEFSVLARETRRWQAIGRTFRPEHVQDVLAPLKGRLQFGVIIAGPSREYLRSHAAILQQGGTSHRPVSWDVHAGTRPERATPVWIAPGTYSFAADELDLSLPAMLVFRDRSGHEIRFEFDLSKLR